MSFFNHFHLKDFQLRIEQQTALELDTIALYPEEERQLDALQSVKRKVEHLGVRHLRNLLQIKHPICYSHTGKPFLKASHLHISISHCPGWISLAVAPYPIGIDMEAKDRNALKIINKFACDDEKILCADTENNWALELWCAKEAIYKLYDLQGLSFKEEIHVKSKEEADNLLVLKGCIKRAHQNPQFEVRLSRQNELILAVAIFRAEP